MIAFLGLGNMGRGMAARLLDSGQRLRVFNRDPAKARALAESGATVAESPAEAARGADAIFAMVSDDDASRAVWLGPGGALDAANPGALAIECSTLSHGWVADLAARTRAKGLRYIDCPVTGLPDAAAAGQLTLLAGADPGDLESARPYLSPLSKEIVHFGGVGAGTAYKLIVNLLGAVQISSLAEALLAAEAAGLDLRQVEYALSKSQAASPQVARNAAAMAGGKHEPVLFSGALRLKDTLYGVRHAEALGQSSRLGRAAEAAYRQLVASGLGDANESRIIDALRPPKK